jgi:hypothetical protein
VCPLRVETFSIEQRCINERPGNPLYIPAHPNNNLKSNTPKQNNRSDPNPSSRLPNINTTIPPHHHASTITTTLPPDVTSARKTRINKDLLACFNRPTTPHPSNPSTPASLKGIGVYTHHEVIPSAQKPRFPHERFTQPTPRIHLLPLGGPQKILRKNTSKPDLPPEILSLYEEVRNIVLWEEKEEKKKKEEEEEEEEQVDPRDTFGGLELPDIKVPSPPSGAGSEDMDIDERLDGGGEERGGGKQSSERRPGSSGGRRTNTAVDVVVGGTDGARTAASAAVGAASGMNAGGTVYDASRDPRRRGR